MQQTNSYPRVISDENLMETRIHGTKDFPFQYYLEDFWAFDLHAVDWHWHSEVEFILVRRGQTECFVGSDAFTLEEGCGLFVNSRILHRFEARAPNLVPNIVFSPALIAPEGSMVYRQYIQPMLTAVLPCVTLRPDTPWQAETLRLLEELFCAEEQPAPNRLTTLRLLTALWEQLYRHIPAPESIQADSSLSSSMLRLQVMMGFIHQHYAQPIQLGDIAAAAFVSKNSALDIFRRSIQQSPIQHLIQYRLQTAAKLLSATEKKVSVIAQETGFTSESYFCRRFRQLFGVSLAEYRQLKKV